MKYYILRSVILCLMIAVCLFSFPPLSKPAHAEDISFTKMPAATKTGEKFNISFKLNKSTDVAVFVLNAKGEIIRHLAAGMLGAKAPLPFAKNSLKQTVIWDGKNDAGESAENGPFGFRVTAGIGAAFSGTAFGSKHTPDSMMNVIGLAASPDGRVYAMSERWKRIWWRGTSIHSYLRNGKYERTLKPFSPSTDPEKLKAVTPFQSPSGRPLPVIYRVLGMNFYPNEDLPQHFAVGPDGNLHFLVSRAAYRKGPQKYLASIASDGSIPYKTYAGGLLPKKQAAGHPNLVVSSDGKWVFATGLESRPVPNSKIPANAPAVWKIPLPARDKAVCVFGNPDKPGNDNSSLNDPRGLVLDGKGHLFVADRGNSRVIKCKESDGSLVQSFDVPSPLWIGFHKKTGMLYAAGENELTLFSLGSDSKAVQKTKIPLPPINPRSKARAHRSFALDDSEKNAVLWTGLNRGSKIDLFRMEESGGKFGTWEKAGYRLSDIYWNICTGLDRKTVACKSWSNSPKILDEDTGTIREMKLTGSSGQTYRMGPNGQIYGMDHWKWGVRRWDKNGKFMPFKATAENTEYKGRLWNRPSGTTAWERDFDVDRHGNIYTKQRGKIYHGRMRIDKYDKDGNFKKTLIWVVSDGCMGPRVDPAGNVYIAESVHPPGQDVPPFFAGKIPKAWINMRVTPHHQYRWMYGSIIKFSPKGGAVWFPIVDKTRDVYAFDGEPKLDPALKKIKVGTAKGDPVRITPGEVQGAEWMWYGCSYILDMHPGHNRRCHCTATEFEVDDFGRSFLTDQGKFQVVVLDTGGNEILRFGEYGNQDYCGENSYVLDPKGKFYRPRRKDDPKDLISPFAEPKIPFTGFRDWV